MANILILGGTQWLGRTLARTALADGHGVACLARGSSGPFEPGAEPLVADRDQPDAYAEAAAREWDLVVELTRYPAHAGQAAEALSSHAVNWVFVSSCSVYRDQSTPYAPETARLVPALESGAEYTDALYGEAKAGCEWLTLASRGGKALLVRPGLIGGPGDPTGRTSYWPLRFAAGRAPVLVPHCGDEDSHVQILDVRDLAAFILAAGLAGRGGPVNAVGAEMPLADVLASAASAGGYAGPVVRYPLERMEDDGVAPWAGPRSLPLVLPAGDQYAGFARRTDRKALAWGLVRRSLAETFADTIAAAPEGPAPAAGLTAEEERALLESLSGAGEPALG